MKINLLYCNSVCARSFVFYKLSTSRCWWLLTFSQNRDRLLPARDRLPLTTVCNVQHVRRDTFRNTHMYDITHTCSQTHIRTRRSVHSVAVLQQQLALWTVFDLLVDDGSCLSLPGKSRGSTSNPVGRRPRSHNFERTFHYFWFEQGRRKVRPGSTTQIGCVASTTATNALGNSPCLHV